MISSVGYENRHGRVLRLEEVRRRLHANNQEAVTSWYTRDEWWRELEVCR